MKPRIARFVSSWPSRWNAAWLGSTPGVGFSSMATIQSCFTSVAAVQAQTDAQSAAQFASAALFRRPDNGRAALVAPGSSGMERPL